MPTTIRLTVDMMAHISWCPSCLSNTLRSIVSVNGTLELTADNKAAIIKAFTVDYLDMVPQGET